MKGQVHLVTSEFPMLPWQAQTTNCGVELDHAELLFCWDDLQTGTKMPETTILLCAKCLGIVIATREKTMRYVYGVREKPPWRPEPEENDDSI